jgi:RND family efflux transporter MFP subunit
MKTKHLKIVIHLLIIAAFGFVVQSCGKTLATENEPIKQEFEIPVTIAEASLEWVAVPIHVSGILRANKESRLSFKTGGIIRKIEVNEGDKVKAGTVLAQLDLKEINQQVAQAKIGLDKAQRDYARIENLYNDTVSTLEQLQNAASALELAKTTLNIAEYNLKFSTINAPSDGIILKKIMEENEITGPGMPIFYFASDEGSWKMNVGVSDKNIVKLKLNDKAEIITDAFPDKPIFAMISKIANAPEFETGLYEVELALNDSDLKFKPGFFARGEIMPSDKISCFKLPVDAIQEGVGNKVSFFIYDEKQGIAKKAETEILFLNNDFVYVGCSAFDNSIKVITQSQKDLNNLDKISVKNQLAKR